MQQSRSPVQPPPAQGVRLDWLVIPDSIRGALEGWAGCRVAHVASQPTGFSPGVAARLRMTDGRRLFVKAVASLPNLEAPAFHRREARIVAALPRTAPVPRLLWSHDDGEWVVLVFEDVEGRHPVQPWNASELGRVLDALAALSGSLTPSPLPLSVVGSAGTKILEGLSGWQSLLDQQPSPLTRLDAWSARHLGALANLEAEAAAAAAGETLLHFDVRADNVLLQPDRIWFVDWPHARIGAAWIDVVLFAPSVGMQGGPPPEQVLARSPAARAADPASITAVIAAAAGFFVRGSLQPPPPGLPTLRAFQAAQGAVACDWLAQRTGWT